MDDSTTPRRKTSWRGRGSGQPAEAKHRWQRDATDASTANGRGRRIPLALRLGIVLAAALAFLAVYLFLILSRPLQVPIIAIAAPAYPQPFPPNGWSIEDVQNLADLDDITIRLHAAQGAISTRTAILENLQDRLDDAARDNPHGPIVLYFNLHAAVDGAGRPCLVPPSASPTDSSTWLPVEQIFIATANHARSDHGEVLVVFDTNRLDVAWSLGVARNTFVERLERLLAADGPHRRIRALAVMTAAGVDEVSQTSSELGGSAFGHFLRQGLAGRADRPEIGGNNDSRVGLRELHAYLAKSVSDWSRRHRDAEQTPLLFAGNDVDFPLTWVCRSKLPEPTAVSSAVSAETIAGLWERAERLERHDPLRDAPLVWTQIRRTLHFLEQAADAGSGYAATARTTAEELDSRLARFERRAADGRIDRWNIFRANDGTTSVDVPAHSLALLRSLGRLEASQTDSWEAVDGELLPARLAPLADEIGLAEAGPVNEAHFLRLLAQSPAASLTPARLGSVVALHRLGETAAAPEDVRAWPWIRDQVVRGDAARRRVEDAAMAAADDEPSAYETAETTYQQALETDRHITEACRLLDIVLVEQVFLARWLTDPRHRISDGQPQRQAELINTALLPMIDDIQWLASHLNTTRPSDEAGITARAAAIRSHRKTIRDEFDRTWTRLLDEPRQTAAILREIDLTLSVPLLPSTSQRSMSPSQQRAMLIRRRDDIARELAVSTADDEQTTTTPAQPLRQMAARWERHPLAAIVEGALPSATTIPQSTVDPQDAERIGQLTRSWLDSLVQSRPASTAARPDVASATGEENSRASDAHDLKSRVTKLRTAAALRSFDQASATEAIVRLTDLNLAALLVGQAQRTLEDFWGPVAPAQEAFFVTAAESLKAAENLAAFDRDVASAVTESKRLLELRRQAAQTGLGVDVSDVLPTSPDRPATAIVDVRPGTGPAGEAVPPGTAALVVGRPGVWSLAEPIPLRVPVAEDHSTLELAIASQELDASSSVDRVGVLFRGNLFDVPLKSSAPTGPTVAFVMPEEAPTTLSLRSTHRQGLSVVFVLDCSASMAEAEPSESFAGASNRLDLARSALSRMLAELATRPNTRVGVVFYGHRVGWRKAPGEDGNDRFQRSVQPGYARTVSDAVMPYNDVEVVEPLGRFDGAVAGEVEVMLESLRPWGETPLYLAIDEALRQFSDADASSERSVVVITDGLNEQSNPSPAARKTSADVLATWERSKAAIEIIGFGLSAGDAGQAASEFGRLAEATDGNYESASNATDLIAALERRIGPASYRVEPTEGGDGVSSPVGTPVTLTDLAELPAGFRVRLDGQQAQVEARGGEALELIAGESGPMISARYLTGSPRQVPLIEGDAGRRSGVLAGLHRPLRTADGGVTFEFSLQNEDRSFRLRPQALWIEVSPLGDDGTASEPYVFYHDRYLPQTPVPVVRWTAANWPADANTAQVRLWGRDTSVEPVAVMPLADLLQAKTATVVTGLEQVRLEAFMVEEAGSLRVDVVERHGTGSPGVGHIAVTCSDAARPREVVHRFDSEHNVVLHTFRFDRTDANDVTNRIAFVVSTRRAIENDGWRLDPPAVVDVSGQADLLVPFRSRYAAEDTPANAAAQPDEGDAPPLAPLLRAPGSQP